MAISRVKNWVALEVLTASDQNAEFNNIINAGVALISPLTGNLDVNLKQLTNMRLEVQTATQAAAQGAGRTYWQSTEGAIHVDTGSLIARTPAITGIQEGFLLGTVNPSGVSGATTYGLVQVATASFSLSGGVLTTASPLVAQVLTGCTLSNDSGTPNTILDVAAGTCSSDDTLVANRILMTLTAMTGTISGTWVVGTGQPKMDTGTVALSTWYHVWVIKRIDTGVTDILFSLSATSPTMPANYGKKRRIGSILTDAAVHIIAFKQISGGEFYWNVPPALGVSTNNPGTAAVTAIATVPTGVVVKAFINWTIDTTGAANAVMLISPLAVADTAPGSNTTPLGNAGGGPASAIMVGRQDVWTNTSASYRYRLNISGASQGISHCTVGWYDPRGGND